jgi:hypothetical protein
MASAGFIAGAMTATYDSSSIGQVADGFTIETTHRKQVITGDVLGPETPQSAVYQGMDVFIEFDLMEYDATAVGSILWPYGVGLGTSGVVGKLDVTGAAAIAKALVLTEVVGTAAENKPNTLTCTRAILAEGFPVEVLFAPSLRQIPIRMRCYLVSGAFFTLA